MIGFVGLSHLGIVSSAAAAEISHGRVVAYHPDVELVRRLGSGNLTVSEPGLAELVQRNSKNLTYTHAAAQLSACKLVYFSIDVSTDDENRSDLSFFQKLWSETLGYLAAGTTLVILSQAPPGFTRKLRQETLASHPEKKFRIFSQVETLVFGIAVERALKPERFIVGAPESGDALPDELASFLKAFDCPLLVMCYESAELAKISINLCLAASVSTANTLAEICEAVGADWAEIVPALKLDRRIGPHAYLGAGLGISGGNLERDLVSIVSMAAEQGTESAVVQSFLVNSRHRKAWVLKQLSKRVLEKQRTPLVALWGLAYKPDTVSTKNSPSIDVLQALPSTQFCAYDPQVSLEKASFPNTTQAKSALDACRGAQALVVMTPWKEFYSADLTKLKEGMAGRCLIDPFRVFDKKKCESMGFEHACLGRS